MPARHPHRYRKSCGPRFLIPKNRTLPHGWGQINAHTIPDCNWQFFRILVNLALKSVGMPYSPELLEDGLCKIDSCYSGDGWSTDGASVQKDYYIPWAIQYYGLLCSKFCRRHRPRRAALYRQRAQLFAQQFVYWFDANGAALPFGRSLTYRFAQNSFLAACIWAGLEPLPLPVMKGLIVRKLQLVAGAENVRPGRYPDHRLLLYPQMYMAERYNAPGALLGHEGAFLLLVFAGLTTSPLVCRSRAHARIGAAQAHAIRQYAGAAPGRAGNSLCRRCQRGARPRTVPGKVRKICLRYPLWLLRLPQPEVLNQAAPDSMLAFVIDDNVFVRKVSKTWKLKPGL